MGLSTVYSHTFFDLWYRRAKFNCFPCFLSIVKQSWQRSQIVSYKYYNLFYVKHFKESYIITWSTFCNDKTVHTYAQCAPLSSIFWFSAFHPESKGPCFHHENNPRWLFINVCPTCLLPLPACNFAHAIYKWAFGKNYCFSTSCIMRAGAFQSTCFQPPPKLCTPPHNP